jgi:hypothetical protein
MARRGVVNPLLKHAPTREPLWTLPCQASPLSRWPVPLPDVSRLSQMACPTLRDGLSRLSQMACPISQMACPTLPDGLSHSPRWPVPLSQMACPTLPQQLLPSQAVFGTIEIEHSTQRDPPLVVERRKYSPNNAQGSGPSPSCPLSADTPASKMGREPRSFPPAQNSPRVAWH